MRIISKEHDYYDSVQIHGQDPKLIYQRKEIEIPKEQQLFTFDYTSYNPYLNRVAPEFTLVKDEQRDIDSFILGFCGKIYPVVRHYYNATRNYLYSNEDTLYLEEIKTGKYMAELLPDRIEKFFQQKISKKFEDTFVKFKVPYFVIYKEWNDNIAHEDRDWDRMKESYRLILNPNLKQYNFQTIKDPFTAFQEIEQYLSGVLAINAPQMVNIADKEKVKKAGFDKWSFRKLPTKRKLNENN